MRVSSVLTVFLAIGLGSLTYACSSDDGTEATTNAADGGTDDAAAEGGSDSAAEASKDGGKPNPGDDAGDEPDDDSGIDEPVPEEPLPLIVLLRVGAETDGFYNILSAKAFFDQYDLEKKAVVATAPLTTVRDDINYPFALSSALGEGAPEGMISRAGDGHSLTVAGYSTFFEHVPPWVVVSPDGPPNISLAPRLVGRVYSDGYVDTVTLVSSGLAPTSVGGAVLNGTDVWVGGLSFDGSGPVQHVDMNNGLNGADTSGHDIIPEAPTGRLALRIFEGRLYTSVATSAGTHGAINAIGTGLSRTAGQTETAVIPEVDGVVEFAFLDTDGIAGPDVLYAAIEAKTIPTTAPGVKKFVYDTAQKKWNATALFTDGVPANGLRGLEAFKHGKDTYIVTTTYDGDKVLEFVDDGSANPKSTVLLTAATSTDEWDDGNGNMVHVPIAYRGVARTPTP